ncbi:MAG: hypothetical protein RBR62_02555 [Bacteroidales bacterium]|jgi:hypothetical protein|nr:hypothetical protein [Bacteroidales bacterium]HKM31863.1 hypothetical protein [Bacteroidales bacterium]
MKKSFLLIMFVSITAFTGCLRPEDPEDNNKTPDFSKPGEFDPSIRAVDSLEKAAPFQ